MNLLALLAPYFERYLTLERVHPTAKYSYKARGFVDWPVIDITMHRPKCTRGSWLYVAVPMHANLAALGPTEKLYIGSQTGDRMFRGDEMAGRNFHHAQMRAGNGNDNAVNYLHSVGRVAIHRASEASMTRALAEDARFAQLVEVLGRLTQKHIGYWLEQMILAAEPRQWRWNTAPPDREAVRMLEVLPPAIP